MDYCKFIVLNTVPSLIQNSSSNESLVRLKLFMMNKALQSKQDEDYCESLWSVYRVFTMYSA